MEKKDNCCGTFLAIFLIFLLFSIMACTFEWEKIPAEATNWLGYIVAIGFSLMVVTIIEFFKKYRSEPVDQTKELNK